MTDLPKVVDVYIYETTRDNWPDGWIADVEVHVETKEDGEKIAAAIRDLVDAARKAKRR